MGRNSSRTGALSEEHGQVAALVVVFFIALIGCAGFVVDVGNAYLTQRKLQTAADAAALAGAQVLPDATAAAATAKLYGSSATGKNPLANLAVSEQVTTSCDSTISSCSPVNVVSVDENATVPTFFAKVLGVDSLKIHVRSSACSPCGNKPVDIVLVLDRTGSMCQDSLGRADPSCTDLNNAKTGIKTFLGFFDPSMAHIGLAVLPPASSVSARCNTPNQSDYNVASAAYTIVPLSNDFRKPDGTLNTSSNLVSTVNCVKGNGTTSYANAIEAAQNELNAHGRMNVPHVIVMMSDGAANTGPTLYSTSSPYRMQPCHQGIWSANNAKAAGTDIYTIGYALDDDTGGCKAYTGAVEKPAISVYEALGGIASLPSQFLVRPGPGELQTIYTRIAEEIGHGSSSLVN